VITYSNICSQGKRKAAKTTPPPDSEAQAAYMDMVREQKRYNRLQAEAKIAEAWEAGMYWRFMREAKRAELLAKGLPVPDMNTISVSDSPFNSGALGRYLAEHNNSDRFVIRTFLHYLQTFHLKIKLDSRVISCKYAFLY
jgi:hypothetical protein